jgi:hypothetical protein
MREWELSYRLGMRPWIAVAYSAPVAAATAVFLIYPIGQGSFSDGMPLGEIASFCMIVLVSYHSNRLSYLNRKTPYIRRVRKSLVFKALPNSTPSGPDPPEGPELDDEGNSLLTSDFRVPGKAFPMKDLTGDQLDNTPAVYAFR